MLMRRWGWRLLVFLAAAVGFYSLSLIAVPAKRPPFVRDHINTVPLAMYGHLSGAALALILGPLQFNAGLRARRLNLHRWTGRLYLAGVTVGGVSGFVLAPMSQAGLVAHAGFGALALAWVGTAAAAYQRIRSGDDIAHRRWMMRNYALTLAAVTLRIYLPASDAAGLPFGPAYSAIAWLCWVPNLAVAEWRLGLRA